MTLSYEPAREEDLELLYRLNRDLIDRYEDTSAIQYDRVLNWVKENLRRQLPAFRRVSRDGELCGFYCLSPVGDRAELDSLFVLPPFQGQGIGTAILNEITGSLSCPLFLYVFRSNTGAIRLYQRLGFRITEEVSPTRFIMQYQRKRQD